MSASPAPEAPTATTSNYEEKRAKQRTRREERAAKRAFEFLKGKVRSQLRKQLDDIMKPNINDLILALASGKGIRLQIEVADVGGPPVTTVPTDQGPVDIESATRALEAAAEQKPLIEIVR
jgi:hypothetical protein